MFQLYYKLVQPRRSFPAMNTPDMVRLNNTQPSTVYSIGRYKDGEDPVISVMNFANWPQVVTITVPVEEWGIHPDSTYCLNEIIGGSYLWRTGSQLAAITTSMNGTSSRSYAITDSIFTLDVEYEEIQLVRNFSIAQNYPNPFNQECVIRFETPRIAEVNIIIYNILGQKVKVLTDDVYEAEFILYAGTDGMNQGWN